MWIREAECVEYLQKLFNLSHQYDVITATMSKASIVVVVGNEIFFTHNTFLVCICKKKQAFFRNFSVNVGSRLQHNISRKYSTFVFSEGKCCFFEPCLCRKVRKFIIIALFVGTPMSWAACRKSFSRKHFSANFCQKIWEIFELFSKRISYSPLPTPFVKFDGQFLQTHL